MTNRTSRFVLAAGARNPAAWKSPAALRAEHQESTRIMALRMLSVTFFLLMGMPLLNVKIGPVPIYAIDLLIFLTWVYVRRMGLRERFPMQGLVILIMITAVLSEFLAGVQLGSLLQPVYLTVRTLLAISLFFSVPSLIRTKNDFIFLVKFGLAGALVTAFLMILSSLPPTQALVARYVFSFSFLLPSAVNIAAEYGYADVAMRGHSLVGISIIGGAFLNTIWALLFILRSDPDLGFKWRIALIAALVAVPMGVVMSYSRGAIAGLLMIAAVALLFNYNKIRQPILIGVTILFLIFSQVGWGSDYFMFQWLETKTKYQLARVDQSAGMTQRLYAYVQPFEVVRENPFFLFLGEGLAREKISGAPSVASGAAVHAVFGMATYAYGMLTAFVYVILLLRAIILTWKKAWSTQNDFSSLFSRALLASLFGFSSWFLLGHAPVSEPRGAQLLFFLFGLVAAQYNFRPASEGNVSHLTTFRKPIAARLQNGRRDSDVEFE